MTTRTAQGGRDPDQQLRQRVCRFRCHHVWSMRLLHSCLDDWPDAGFLVPIGPQLRGTARQLLAVWLLSLPYLRADGGTDSFQCDGDSTDTVFKRRISSSLDIRLARSRPMGWCRSLLEPWWGHGGEGSGCGNGRYGAGVIDLTYMRVKTQLACWTILN